MAESLFGKLRFLVCNMNSNAQSHTTKDGKCDKTECMYSKIYSACQQRILRSGFIISFAVK